MSLIGSLEDLGLGDILQIVTLSRKSGLLLLRSEQGEGRLLFHDGLVRGAFVKGEPEDLRQLLVGGGFLDAEAFDRAEATAAEHGTAVPDELAACADFSKERLDSVRREHLERVALYMFRWRTGEFSFEVSDGVGGRDADLLLATGVNSQFLIMEAARLGDEGDRGDAEPDEASPDGDGEELTFSGEDPPTQEILVSDLAATDEILDFDATAPDPEDLRLPSDPTDALALATVARVDGEPQPLESLVAVEEVENDAPVPPPSLETTPDAEGAEEADGGTTGVSLDVQPADESGDRVAVSETPAVAEPAPAAAPEAAAPPARAVTRLVVIDPDLHALEWLKATLKEVFERVHIFQRPEAGVARIRQYLGRGELPAVALASELPPDPLTGAGDSSELVTRLRALAPRMPIFSVVPGAENEPVPAGPPGTDAVLKRPPAHALARRRGREQLIPAADALRDGMRPHLDRRDARPEVQADSSLRRLHRISHRLRDASARGDVLSLVLEFAAECFPRVAMFMVRDDVAVGMAGLGLSRAGGPGDEALCRIEIPATMPAAFRAVVQEHRAYRGAPSNDGDRELARLLGGAIPQEIFAAPIESGEQIVALLYADRLPDPDPIGDTEVLEIVLHEAGLALERAVLERALAESRGNA